MTNQEIYQSGTIPNNTYSETYCLGKVLIRKFTNQENTKQENYESGNLLMRKMTNQDKY